MYGEGVIDHFGINCVHWEESKSFYDKVLGVLGYTRQMDMEVAIGYGADGHPSFWIGDASDGDVTGPNREMHLAFVPILLGGGERLFENLDGAPAYDCVEHIATERVIHTTFVRRAG